MASPYNKEQKKANLELAKKMKATKLVRVHRKTGKTETLRYDPQYIKKLCKLTTEECYSIGLMTRPKNILARLNQQQMYDAIRKANREAKRARKNQTATRRVEHRQQAAG